MLRLILFLGIASSIAGKAVQPASPWDGRIVGGEPVNITDFPYQVSVRFAGIHICGGTIISKTHIVTAAHCVADLITSLFVTISIRAGSSFSNSGGQVINAIKITPHPKYNDSTTDYDIAVIELVSHLKFGEGVNSIPIADNNDKIITGADSVVSGWGTLKSGGESPKQLQAVTVPLITTEDCKKYYKELITDNMICAGYVEGGKDSCQGDSGGPIVSGGKLVGVVSWGYGCAEPNYPGVYSHVSQLSSFVKQVAG